MLAHSLSTELDLRSSPLAAVDLLAVLEQGELVPDPLLVAGEFQLAQLEADHTDRVDAADRAGLAAYRVDSGSVAFALVDILEQDTGNNPLVAR